MNGTLTAFVKTLEYNLCMNIKQYDCRIYLAVTILNSLKHTIRDAPIIQLISILIANNSVSSADSQVLVLTVEVGSIWVLHLFSKGNSCISR